MLADGGGIRGLSSLYILRHVFYRLNYDRAEQGQSAIEPWQYFDLIGGTSTGGIIALMLGRLRMSIDECVAAYENLGEAVFRAPQRLGHRARFDERKFEEVIKKVISNRFPGSDPEAVQLIEDSEVQSCYT